MQNPATVTPRHSFKMLGVRLSRTILQALIIYLLYRSGYGVIATATVSPPETALVCRGHQLDLTCNVTGSFLQWRISPTVHEGETTAKTHTFIVTSLSPHDQTQNLQVNSTLLTFSRNSAQNIVPLVSKLIINATSHRLNGTMVTCSDVETSESVSTTINIINENLKPIKELEITILSEVLEEDGVMVTLEWTEENFLYSYNVSVSPQLEVIFIGRVRVQLKVPYNIFHNVNVTAIPPCQQNNILTFVAPSLYYETCGNLAIPADEGIKIIEYSDPAVNGSNVTYGCLLDFVLYTSICMNGEWAPNPEDFELNCSGVMMMVTSSDSGRFNGTVLGGVLGVIVFMLLLIVSIILMSIIIVAKAKAKGANDNRQTYYNSERYISHNRSIDIELSPAIHNDHKTATSGLVYVDIDQSLLGQQLHHVISTHNLDDDAIEYTKLNLGLFAITTSQKSQPADKIAESLFVNLDNLLMQLRPQVTCKWYQFGEAAGIEKEVLDECAKTCSPEDCIVEMLDYWLRNSVHQPTWNDVVEVLKAIKLPQLAHDIENIYTTGKLPLDVDMNSIPQIQESLKVESVQSELPPPIPPKVMDYIMDQDVDHNKSLNLQKSRIASDNHSSLHVPTLPLKPTNRSEWSKAT